MSLRPLASLALLLGSAGLIGASLAPSQTGAIVSRSVQAPVAAAAHLQALAEKPGYESAAGEAGSLSEVLGDQVEATPVAKATRPPRPTATPTVAKAKQQAPAKAPTKTPTPRAPAKTATAKAQPAAATTPTPSAIRTAHDLSGSIDAYLEQRGGRVAYAVYDANDGLVLSRDGDTQFALASLAKVHLVTAYLTALEEEGREPTASEESLMRSMIGVSDNEAADALWQALGGAESLDILLDRGLFPQLLPGDGGLWGATADSADDVALLFLDLYETEHMPDEVGSYVLTELARVTNSQRWGVSAGASGASVYVKNGWYPGEEGWRVTSAALIYQSSTGKTYGIAIMTDRNSTFDAGKSTIEGVAKLINTFMLTQQ